MEDFLGFFGGDEPHSDINDMAAVVTNIDDIQVDIKRLKAGEVNLGTSMYVISHLCTRH